MGEAEPRGGACPSCDTPGSWKSSKRHRFNPFGAVTLMVLAFWASLGGWLLGIGQIPALTLVAAGIVMLAARRTALVCTACGFVRSRRGKRVGGSGRAQ
jgi:hypothetical protein